MIHLSDPRPVYAHQLGLVFTGTTNVNITIRKVHRSPGTDTMPEPDNSGSRLQFRSVRGTSAKNPGQFAAVGDKLAYTAGGGVVVSTIGRNGHIETQRFFVANHNVELANLALSQLSYPAGIDGTTETETKRDAYGYPITVYPFTYEGKLTDSNDSLRANEHKDSTGGASPVKSKNRVRAVSCLALAPNGRVLAVGESGYRPRVLLFSLAKDSSNSPFAVIYEHSFEVKSIAFSPDLRSFCSLGNLADGFLHVWKYSASSVTLRAGNKCSSVVNSLLWHETESGEGNIITAGLRFLKVWTCEATESAKLKVGVLKGRNVVLGKYLDQNLQEAVPLSHDEVMVRGDTLLFVLSLRGGSLKFLPVMYQPGGLFGLLVNYENDQLFYFDDQSQPHTRSLADLQPLNELDIKKSDLNSPLKSSLLILNISPSSENDYGPIIKSQLLSSGRLLFLTKAEQIKAYDPSSSSIESIVSQTTASIAGGKRTTNGQLLLFSSDGDIFSIPDNGSSNLIMSHELTQSDVIANELTAVELVGKTLFLGDKYGQLSIFDISSGEAKAVLHMKAHSSTINEIIRFEVGGIEMLCSISRDRMIQIYYQQDNLWELMRTLPTHNGNLIAVKFLNSCLYVCSSDRSVSVHEIVHDENLNPDEPVSVYRKKIITLKATPLAMVISPSGIVISTNDKNIQVYDTETLELKRTLKLVSDETNESLCVEKLTLLPGNHIAVASSDKSLRIFHLVSGRHMSVGWGHSETTLGLFENELCLTSLGSDGCLFEWTLLQGDKILSPATAQSSKESTPEASPLYAKVTRKILPTPVLSAFLSPKKSQSTVANDIIQDPESPTRRLTAATLKRLEAKKQLSDKLNSSVYARLSSASKSPTRDSPTKLNSPIKTGAFPRGSTPNLRHSSPSRTGSISHTVSSERSHSVLLIPPLARNNLSSPSKRELVSPVHDEVDLFEETIAGLAAIKLQAQNGQFTEDNKVRLRKNLEEILNVLDGTTYTDLLQKYSEELASLVKERVKELT